MSSGAALVAQAYETMRRLAEHTGLLADPHVQSLLAELELQISHIEIEAARLWQENLDLTRRVAGGESPSATILHKPYSTRIVPPKTDIRQTMQKVSEFYERASKQRMPMRLVA